MTTPTNTKPTTARVGMSDSQIDQFIASHGGLEFLGVTYRKDATATSTTPFGIDISTPQLGSIRIHLGTDRKKGRFGYVFAPFDGVFHIEQSSDYGNLFRLRVRDEFEVRIAHMKLQDIAVRTRIDSTIKAGELIGLAGNEGKSFGIHTHTEIVSLHGESALCEAILKAKGIRSDFFTPDQLVRAAGSLWPKLKDDMTRKGVIAVSPVKLQKLDRWTSQVQTYYDSRTLFGF